MTCETCFRGCTEIFLSHPTGDYLRRYKETKVWFDHGFFDGFGAALVHHFHRNDIEVIHVLYSESDLTKREMIPLQESITTAYAVLHSRSVQHCVVAEARLATKEVLVIDGFGCALKYWIQGITRVLL